ncbi:hypothetical protein H2199_002471 [Coniosporium tulheliwenetii]|uniref:Uncharacterized protein n=1 Tax=Coniosporium tulheliwenetii TaxID=3383036 RepID=A0ACC2ZFG2_9PEZI|nr:hypothetical protein H2199_002471 [Cladosporium sp. JES 115]
MGQCDHRNVFCITGSEQSRVKTHSPDIRDDKWTELNRAGEMVSWVFFLDQLHHLAASYPEGSPYKVRDNCDPPPPYSPCLRVLKRTWDFMSPDIIKPLAAVLGRRLGMIWTQFRPGDSILRAEGNQMTITSTNVRSVGTILQFDMTLRKIPHMDLKELYIPKQEADKMGFGVVPVWYSGDRNTFGDPPRREIRIGTPEDCVDTMKLLCGECPATVRLQDHLQRGRWTPGFSDIIPLASPFIYTKESSITRIPKPSHYAVGLTVFSEGFLVFGDRLEKYIKKKQKLHKAVDQAECILGWYNKLKRYEEWVDENLVSPSNNQDTVFLHTVFDKGSAAQEYLEKLNNKRILRYEDLMRCHIERAVFYKDDASQSISEEKSKTDSKEDAKKDPRTDSKKEPQKDSQKGSQEESKKDSKKEQQSTSDVVATGDSAWKSKGMHKYFDYIEDKELIFKAMKGLGYTESHDLLIQAWVTMIFRALCWHRCHYMVGGQRVPSQYWDSRFPIYLT